MPVTQNVTAGCTRIRHILYTADDKILSHDRDGPVFHAGDGRFWTRAFVFSGENWTLKWCVFSAFLPKSSGSASDGCAGGLARSDTVYPGARACGKCVWGKA